MAKPSKLYKTKQVDLEQYSAIELSYLLLDVLKEVAAREKATSKLLDEYNQKTYEYTHDIELNPTESKKEKLERYNKLEEHLIARRLAKREQLVMDEVLEELDSQKHVTRLGETIKRKQNYFKLNDGDRVMKPREWKNFYETHLCVYIPGRQVKREDN